jgi:TPR repeat protein
MSVRAPPQDWSRMPLIELQAAAESGAVGAQFALGKKIQTEDESSEEAVRWFRASAEQGHADAQVALGRSFKRGQALKQDFAEAADWFHKAAEQGHAQAQALLGNCFYNGRGVERDLAAAVSWYHKAAEQGHAEAQNELGYRFDAGKGVDKDVTEAAKWFRKAAEQGHAEAQFNLGACFDFGTGVEQDPTEAVRWYRKAAEQGHAVAQNNLGFCFEYGDGVDQDFAEAASWYRKAAEQGNEAAAQSSLGACFYDGKGVDQDFAEAVRWYRKAAKQGHAIAQVSLGSCCERGEGVDQDHAEAARWFRKAADQRDAEACEIYGELLMDGKGVARNCDEALVWLKRHPGSESARATIAEIEKEASFLAAETAFSKIAGRIRAGDSVFGTTPEGNTLVHTAAMNLALDSVSLLFEHPSFDTLVVRTNTAGQLPRDVVGHQFPASDSDSVTGAVIASVLSCRRSTRAACLLWCLHEASCCAAAKMNPSSILPREVGELIARLVVGPQGAVDLVFDPSQLSFDTTQLACSVRSSWKHLPAKVTLPGSHLHGNLATSGISSSDVATALRERLAEVLAEASEIREALSVCDAEANVGSPVSEASLKQTADEQGSSAGEPSSAGESDP